MGLRGKNILITGSAARIGKAMALALANAGANVIIHYRTSEDEAEKTQSELKAKGVESHILPADLNDLENVPTVIERSLAFGPIFALVNNASIFENITFSETNLDVWNRHMNVNLTAPFILSQSFANSIEKNKQGRIVNILDWRATRPGNDHFPYTISKAGLAALTRSMAISLAPHITVNGIALGAVLPPSDGGKIDHITKDVPMGRWANLNEIGQTLLFLLDGPSYITGEIIHLDGGRHLV